VRAGKEILVGVPLLIKKGMFKSPTCDVAFPIVFRLGAIKVVVGESGAGQSMITRPWIVWRLEGSVNMVGEATRMSFADPRTMYRSPNIVVQLLMVSMSLCDDKVTGAVAPQSEL